MDKLAGMNAFTKVVALGSYAEAGRQLGLTRSAVSKAVMELEQLLGARLLDRTTRRVGPTEAGRAFYERCVDILASIEEAELAVSRLHDEPKGVLKINGPMSFGTLYLGSAVADFMAAYSDLKVELSLNDRLVDPIEEGFDVTIRIGELADSSLIARKLAPARRVLAASPEYLGRHGEPHEPADLARHRCLNFGHTTHIAALAADARRGDHLGSDRLVAVLQQRRCAGRGRPQRTRHHDAADIPRRSRYRGRTIARGDGRISADRAWNLCDLCAEPLSRRQDARADRLSGRPFR